MFKHLLACSGGLIFLVVSNLHAAAPVELPLLPDAVESFGAAEHDGWLYVYGGRQSARGEPSDKGVSLRFARCKVGGSTTWEELPAEGPRQNLALVSCDKYLYRVGGSGAIEPGPLESVDDFARFDPETNEWTRLKPLPSPRSSHDAVSADGKIYVIGGWHHEAGKARDWHDSALVYDTTTGDDATWQSLPIPSFRRRNLAVTTWQNCIWAIGGRDDYDVNTRTVFCFDPQRGYWSEGPELPMQVDGMQGYGVAALGMESGLHVCGADGVVYRLKDPYGEWQATAQMRVARYCHRLLPEGKNTFLALAGHSVSFGPTRNIERIRVSR